MGWRLRKSIKLLPGVRLNLSKSGISTSIGGRGATLNLKPGRPAKVTVGLPGTGISYSDTIGGRAAPAQPDIVDMAVEQTPKATMSLGWAVVLGAIILVALLVMTH